MSYNHSDIDKKWQKTWEEAKIFEAKNDSKKDPYYLLVEFPFPSGAGLHVGHPRSYTALDVIARKRRMEGYNVLYPIGWDAFGLPTENYAIKTGRKPQDVTKENIDNFRRQLKSLGLSFDWSREVNTTDPAYYKWTQWQFLEFFKAGLAYKDTIAINWCTSCKIGLANEEVVNAACERCGGEVEMREKEQWMIAITKFADRLIDDLETVDFLPKIAKQQVDWIGRSEGAKIRFDLGEVREVLVATGNEAKLERNRFVCEGSNIALREAVDYGMHSHEVNEGSDLVENARMKAQVYAGNVDVPVLGMDSAFVLEGVDMDPAEVRRSVVTEEEEAALSQREIADRMLAHYKGLAEARGGVIEGHWHDVFVCIFPDGTEKVTECKRPIQLSTKVHEPVDEFFPIRSLYINRKTGKYPKEQTEEETRVELEDYRVALLDALQPTIEVFTTRPDTLYGVTYMVLAPEHPLALQLATDEQSADVETYIEASAKKTDIERGDAAKEKTGVFTGAYAKHPLTGEYVPIWVADYVLMNYGTGAVMAVPAHDERDFAFAKKYDLPVKQVVDGDEANLDHEAFIAKDGKLVNSGAFDRMTVAEGIAGITSKLEELGKGEKATTYKLRDWVFSRQRYWGEPIPLVHCEACDWVPIPDDQLPVVLPEIDAYLPTDDGESPLAAINDWVNTECPSCGGPAKRETDTMPNWAGSSWYFLRYTDPHNSEAFASEEALKYWMPVNLYNGGMEHTTLHLLYSRFWNKFLHDRGHVPVSEPYHSRRSHGLILAEDGSKMSKSKGNVVNPDDIVTNFGADTLRMYELFLGPFSEPAPWSENGVMGVKRFLDRVMRLEEFIANDASKELTSALHKMLKKVNTDIESMSFNTAVAAMMSYVNELHKAKSVSKDSLHTFLRTLVPFAPHVANELYEKTGGNEILESLSWPEFSEELTKDDVVTIAVQVNGKLRATLEMDAGSNQAKVEAAARAEEHVAKYLEGEVKKVIFVPDKLVNFVV
ncbi:MAG: leucine--tRNA ligase [bacterium]|nr:leucine--tRNA ligase [bacterium]